jgi:hypothetical protein
VEILINHVQNCGFQLRAILFAWSKTSDAVVWGLLRLLISCSEHDQTGLHSPLCQREPTMQRLRMRDERFPVAKIVQKSSLNLTHLLWIVCRTVADAAQLARSPQLACARVGKRIAQLQPCRAVTANITRRGQMKASMMPHLPESRASGPPTATNCASSLKKRFNFAK